MTEDRQFGDERIERVTQSLLGMRTRLTRAVAARIHPSVRLRVDPADVVQESMIELLERIAVAPDDPQGLYRWARFLTLQKLAQVHRRHLDAQARDVRREIKAPVAGPDASVSAISFASLLLAPGASPSEGAWEEERRLLLVQALGKMKPSYRELLVLRYFEELSNQESAAILTISEATASDRHLRALRQLKAILAEIGLHSVSEIQ